MATPDMLDKLGFVCNDGVFILRHDVVNRQADRRYKRQFDAAETWRAGMLIQVRNHLDDERVPILRACNGQHLSGDIICHQDNKGQWEPLLNALDNPPQTIKTVLATLDMEGLGWLEPLDILAFMLSEKVIGYYDLLRKVRELGQMPDDKFEEWRKREGV